MLIWNTDRQTYWQTQVWQWDIYILCSEIPNTFLSWVYVHLPVDNDSLLIFSVFKKVSDTSWKNCWFEGVIAAVWIICLHFLMILCSRIWNFFVSLFVFFDLFVIYFVIFLRAREYWTTQMLKGLNSVRNCLSRLEIVMYNKHYYFYR